MHRHTLFACFSLSEWCIIIIIIIKNNFIVSNLNILFVKLIIVTKSILLIYV